VVPPSSTGTTLDVLVSSDAQASESVRRTLTDAGLVDAPTPGDAAAGDAAATAFDLTGKVVFHAGDSMVGGEAGLNRALRTHFKELGAKYASDTVVSASVVNFNHGTRFLRGVQRTRPDIVIVTLGANDVFVPSPAMFAAHIRGIVKKIGDRECYWISPPTWKKDTGIVDVIKDNCAPCKFFDSRGLEVARAGDHIHPTDKGGAYWASQFWEFFLREHGASPHDPSLGDAGLLDAAH
jgi:acyl-CoA thioesterase-1